MLSARWALAFLIGWLALADRAAWADELPAPTPRIGDFAADVRPVFAQYCFRCHAGDEPKGDMSLDGYQDAGPLLSNRKLSQAVIDRLKAGDMPPEGEPRPDEAKTAAIAHWLEGQLTSAERTIERNPGRVTVRRLNRAEYNNTIRDLLGIDFRPADSFPTDDVGYGFDNNGDVLTLTPLLLEKYLAAAQAIVEQTIIVHPRLPVLVHTDAARALGHNNGSAWSTSAWQFVSTGGCHLNFHAAEPGEYCVKAQAFGQQAGPEVAKMALAVDGKRLTTVEVDGSESNPRSYQACVKLEAGEHRFSVAFVNDYYEPDDPDPNQRDRNLVVEWLEIDGPTQAAYANLPESHRRLIPGDAAADNRELARRVLSRLASRAFRRPTTEAEQSRLGKLFEQGASREESFAAGIQLALEAILVSPHFLFRIELDSGSADGLGPLNDYEVANRLAYFLWSSMPDDQLFALAAEGKLRDPAVLRAQATRMLADEKSRGLVENFAAQWLQLRQLSSVAPDKELFPNFDESLRRAMREETELFFAAMISEDRSVLDLLDADFTFLNERLAKHYGIIGIHGDRFRRVTMSGDERGGILTHASVLTVTSNPTRTSPVKRGKWVLEALLGAPPPPPPPGVVELDNTPEAQAHASLRERMEIHRSKAECAACHSRMDPIGFGLENFDAIGAWRKQDGAAPIDPTGSLGPGRSFSGPADLKRLLRADEKPFVRCLAGKLLTYALGRGLEPYDEPLVSELVASARTADY